MASNQDSKQGNAIVECQWVGGKEPKVRALDFQGALSGVSRLKVSVALHSSELHRYADADAPVEVRVRIGGMGLFRGKIVDVSLDSEGLSLIYEDALCQIGRHSESEFFKEQSLDAVLRELVRGLGLRPGFFGGFSDLVPSQNILGRSYLDELRSLGERYGFSFFARSYAEELVFLRAGSWAQERSLASDEKFTRRVSSRSSRKIISSAELRYFNSGSGAQERKDWAQPAIYEPLGKLRSGSSWERRRGWASATGREERLANTESEFKGQGARFAHEASERALGGDTLVLELSRVAALPGDLLSIPGQGTSGSMDYLVQQLGVVVAGSVPRVRLVGVRA